MAVEDLAREAAMSARTFARRFRQELGPNPHQWLMNRHLRAEATGEIGRNHCRRLLLTSELRQLEELAEFIILEREAA